MQKVFYYIAYTYIFFNIVLFLVNSVLNIKQVGHIYFKISDISKISQRFL